MESTNLSFSSEKVQNLVNVKYLLFLGRQQCRCRHVNGTSSSIGAVFRQLLQLDVKRCWQPNRRQCPGLSPQPLSTQQPADWRWAISVLTEVCWLCVNMHLYLSMWLWLEIYLLECVHFALNVFNSLRTGVLPTIPSASDFNTVLSSDQNTLDTHSQHTHSQHSTSQEDLLDQDETNLCPAAVQLADAQVCVHHEYLLICYCLFMTMRMLLPLSFCLSVMGLSIQVVFKPLLSHIGIQPQDAPPLSYKMYFGEHLSFSGTLECLRADIVDSDTSKERKNKRAHR